MKRTTLTCNNNLRIKTRASPWVLPTKSKLRWSLLTKRSLELKRFAIDYCIDILINVVKKCNTPLFCSQNRLSLLLFFISSFLSSSSGLLELADSAIMQSKRRFRWQINDLMAIDIDRSTHTEDHTCMSHFVTTKHYITLDFLFFVLKDFRSIAEHY